MKHCAQCAVHVELLIEFSSAVLIIFNHQVPSPCSEIRNTNL